MQWETVIGLEVHAQLNTKSKIFSGAPTAYGASPNTQACAIDLGLPGVLPVLNKAAVQKAVTFGLATGCTINPKSVFARKNYFYPDLPKGYQISQYELPIVHGGHLEIEVDGQTKTIGINRAHLEEDAGKSLHEDFHGMTGVDLNRAGTPLLEIVTEPDLRSAQEAVAYLKTLHALVRYLDICDGNMQEGSFRCDANVSVRLKGAPLGTRTEMKNINSFKFVEQAIEYEVERQIDLIESGKEVTQETRLFDPVKQETRPMRSKEEANDYRYFPDPDLLPVAVSQAMIDELKANLPELPKQKQARFQALGLNAYDASALTATKEVADFFEQALSTSKASPKLIANWVTSEWLGALNKHQLSVADSPIKAEQLGQLVERISDNTISGKIAKQVFESMWSSGQDPDTIIEQEDLKQVTDTGMIEGVIDEILANNPDQVEQYRQGKDKVFGFFVGQVMKVTKGKANPKAINDLLKEKLKS